MAISHADAYDQRLARINAAIALEKPDRVPIFLMLGLFPARYAGITYQQAFYDLNNWLAANEKTIEDFQPDLYFQPGAAVITGGAVHDRLQTRLLKLPGRDLGPDVPFQFVEGEYMSADEYDAFLDDPSDFALRIYTPRIFGALEGLALLPPLKSMVMGYVGATMVGMFALPPLAEALRAVTEAAAESMRWTSGYMEFEARMNEREFPAFSTAITLAPFDVISDMLRGMRGAMLDMYRCPDKLVAAQEKLLPLLVETAVTQARMSGNPRVFIPMHRGADGFMSLEQFDRFYWPCFKDLVESLIAEGLVPCPFFEGTYDQRMHYLAKLPPGKTMGIFDRSDLFKAKEVIGEVMCIAGDMPLSLLQAGNAELVKEYARKLIDVVGRDGGFIMSSNTVLDEADPELVKVWVEFTMEYGSYA